MYSRPDMPFLTLVPLIILSSVYRISAEQRRWLGRILSTLDTIISSFPIKLWQVSFAKHRVWLAEVSWAAWTTRATFESRLQRHRWCHYRTLSVNKRYFPCIWRRDIHPLPGKPAAECHDVGCCMILRRPGQFEWIYTGLEARVFAGKCLATPSCQTTGWTSFVIQWTRRNFAIPKVGQFSWLPANAVCVTSLQVVVSIVESIPVQKCNHEKADTRIVVHVLHPLNQGKQTIYVHTVETDVVVIITGMIWLRLNIWATSEWPLAWANTTVSKNDRFYHFNAIC